MTSSGWKAGGYPYKKMTPCFAVMANCTVNMCSLKTKPMF